MYPHWIIQIHQEGLTTTMLKWKHKEITYYPKSKKRFTKYFFLRLSHAVAKLLWLVFDRTMWYHISSLIKSILRTLSGARIQIWERVLARGAWHQNWRSISKVTFNFKDFFANTNSPEVNPRLTFQIYKISVSRASDRVLGDSNRLWLWPPPSRLVNVYESLLFVSSWFSLPFRIIIDPLLGKSSHLPPHTLSMRGERTRLWPEVVTVTRI
jgi:hypothetical protein